MQDVFVQTVEFVELVMVGYNFQNILPLFTRLVSVCLSFGIGLILIS